MATVGDTVHGGACNGEVVVRDAKGAEVAQAIVTFKLSAG